MVTAAALRRLWTDVCTIETTQTVEDPVTHIATPKRVVVAEAIPCRLSYETVSASAVPDPASAVVQSVKVFLAPDMPVPAGSRLTITRPGHDPVSYRSSGKPAIHANHQEVRLEIEEDWA